MHSESFSFEDNLPMHFIILGNASPSHTHNSKGRRRKDSKLCCLSCLSEQSLGPSDTGMGSILPIRYWCKAQLRTTSEVQVQCSGSASGCPYRLWSLHQTHRHKYIQTLSHALFLILCTLSARNWEVPFTWKYWIQPLQTLISPTLFGNLNSSALSHFLSTLQMPGQLLGQGLYSNLRGDNWCSGLMPVLGVMR